MAAKFAVCLLVVSAACAKQLNFDDDFFPNLNDDKQSEENADGPSWFQQIADPPKKQPEPEPPKQPEPVFEDEIFQKPAAVPEKPEKLERPERPYNPYLPPERPERPERPELPSWYPQSSNNHYSAERPDSSWYQPPRRPLQYTNDNRGQLRRAESCQPQKCQSPNCRCSDVYLSREIDERDIPQLVTVTFDDAVTALNYNYIKESMSNLRNPDGCPIQATFFVSHEYTDYAKVHLLWSQGHEIALHSITHSPYTKYWRNADVETLIKEFGGQRQMMAHFANMEINDIVGMRVPLFELSGNNSFLAMKQIGLTYDSSWPTQHFVSPGIWPYSLDYASVQDCPIGICPTASIPGVWVNPILSWEDVEGHRCSMVDACPYPPEDDVDAIFHWMVGNFNKTYHSNRAPFGVYLHASWFLKGDNHFEAYKKFLRYLNQNPDVYIVSSSRTLEYVRNPKIGKPFDNCQALHEPTCKERFCRLMKTDTKTERWMKSCMPCPAVYPWLGNPFGKAIRTQNYF